VVVERLVGAARLGESLGHGALARVHRDRVALDRFDHGGEEELVLGSEATIDGAARKP
jgi:hypothetical protein